jgi:hypothetical protein
MGKYGPPAGRRTRHPGGPSRFPGERTIARVHEFGHHLSARTRTIVKVARRSGIAPGTSARDVPSIRAGLAGRASDQDIQVVATLSTSSARAGSPGGCSFRLASAQSVPGQSGGGRPDGRSLRPVRDRNPDQARRAAAHARAPGVEDCPTDAWPRTATGLRSGPRRTWAGRTYPSRGAAREPGKKPLLPKGRLPPPGGRAPPPRPRTERSRRGGGHGDRPPGLRRPAEARTARPGRSSPVRGSRSGGTASASSPATRAAGGRVPVVPQALLKTLSQVGAVVLRSRREAPGAVASRPEHPSGTARMEGARRRSHG